MHEELKTLVGHLVLLLVKGEFDTIESMTQGVRLSAEQIKVAVWEYGRTLTLLPPEAFNFMDVVEIDSETADSWSIVMPLWTTEEGRSDLSIELTVSRHNSGFAIEFDDIHVM